MKRRLRRPSPALVISVIALVAALSGSAYAIKKIGTKQLKKGAVTTKKIKNGAVTTGKIGNEAVTEAKLATDVRGKAVAYATVAANGNVVEEKSRGVTDVNVGKPGGAGGAAYCLHGLPPGYDSAIATGVYDGSYEFEGPTLPSVAKAPLPDVDCDPIANTQWEVLTYRPAGAGSFADGAFVIAFFK